MGKGVKGVGTGHTRDQAQARSWHLTIILCRLSQTIRCRLSQRDTWGYRPMMHQMHCIWFGWKQGNKKRRNQGSGAADCAHCAVQVGRFKRGRDIWPIFLAHYNRLMEIHKTTNDVFGFGREKQENEEKKGGISSQAGDAQARPWHLTKSSVSPQISCLAFGYNNLSEWYIIVVKN